ncbi:MAG TPA: hypothetical protein PK988_06770 [Candidatus Sumerlaeota bacterium]|nr:hypothetical protein [Candidatus Sumerlaeota bacterium]
MDATAQEILSELDSMIVHQREKCLKLARRIVPHLTPEDLMNPFDWPEVATNPQFVWEDGLLAGLQSAHTAICAHLRAKRDSTP